MIPEHFAYPFYKEGLQEIFIEMKNKSYELKARVNNSAGELKAPETGNMSSRIK